jgi:hypothetical protein
MGAMIRKTLVEGSDEACGGPQSQLTFFRLQHSSLSDTHSPFPSSPAFIMSILLSDRQADDLYVSHVLPWPSQSIKPVQAQGDPRLSP